MIPYIICVPDYYNGSAGIRCLHKLCHDLNTLGYEAYVTAKTSNKNWNTPTLTGGQFEYLASTGANVLYSEITKGNPFGAKRIIRYLQQYIGFLGGDTIYDKNVTIFCYSKIFLQPGWPRRNILTQSIIEPELFNTKNVGKRKFVTYYFGKKDVDNYIQKGIRETETIKIIRRLPICKPGTRKEVADLLKASKILYCYDDLTAMIDEARLCGCPVVIYSNRYKRSFYKKTIGGDGGIAMGDSPNEVAYAMATVKNFREKYKKIWKNYPRQLKHFIEVTQK